MAEPHPEFFTADVKAVNNSEWGSVMAPSKGQENLPSSKAQSTIYNDFKTGATSQKGFPEADMWYNDRCTGEV